MRCRIHFMGLNLSCFGCAKSTDFFALETPDHIVGPEARRFLFLYTFPSAANSCNSRLATHSGLNDPI
jgi:hypothetical protein